MSAIKASIDKSVVLKEFYEKYGSNHIAGIDCANGYIYAPVEGEIDDKGYLYNFILLYDCETLEYTGTYYDMTSKYLTDGSVRVEFTRSLPNYNNEAEDICVYSLPDGTLFHIVDYDMLINTNINHYKPVSE